MSAVTSVNFVLDIFTSMEDGRYLIEAQPINVATFGDTPTDAVSSMIEALDSYLGSLAAHDELISEFDRLGVKYEWERELVDAAPSPVQVDVPPTVFEHSGPARGRALIAC